MFIPSGRKTDNATRLHMKKKGSFKEGEAQEPNTSFLRRYAEGSKEERHIKACTHVTVLDPELFKKQKAACTIQVRV